MSSASSPPRTRSRAAAAEHQVAQEPPKPSGFRALLQAAFGSPAVSPSVVSLHPPAGPEDDDDSDLPDGDQVAPDQACVQTRIRQVAVAPETPPARSTSIVSAVKARSAARARRLSEVGESAAKIKAASEAAAAQKVLAVSEKAAATSARDLTTAKEVATLRVSEHAAGRAKALLRIERQQMQTYTTKEAAAAARAAAQVASQALDESSDSTDDAGSVRSSGGASSMVAASDAGATTLDYRSVVADPGPVQYLLLASKDPVLVALAKPLLHVEIVAYSDLALIEFDELKAELIEVGVVLKRVTFKKLVKAVKAAAEEQTAAEARAPKKAAAQTTAPVGGEPESDASSDGGDDGMLELLKKTGLAALGSRKAHPGAPPKAREMREAWKTASKATTKKRSSGVILPEWTDSLPLLGMLLSRLSADDAADESGLAALLVVLLRLHQVEPVDAMQFDVVAEQVESFLMSLVLDDEPFAPDVPGKRGVRDTVRSLVKTRDARVAAVAAREKAEKAVKEKSDGDAKLLRHLWTAPSNGKGDSKHSLEHSRAIERMQCVMDNRPALTAVRDLYTLHGDWVILCPGQQVRRRFHDSGDGFSRSQ